MENLDINSVRPFGAYFRTDFKELARIYSERLPKLKEVASSIEELIVEEIKSARIDVINIETRIKTLESFLEKCMRKNINNPFTDVAD